MLVTRFAPSPTGLLHVGNIRTALVAWLNARASGGRFILRIDDTDSVRSSVEYIEAIKEDLSWLGITWDTCFLQSERMERYEKAKQELIETGRLYPCYETPEELEIKRKTLLSRNLPPIYDRASLHLTESEKGKLESAGIKPHWRFLLQGNKICFSDRVRGAIEFYTNKLSDPILIRADGTMTYAIASVVDDIEFGITDIVRGEDHISNSAIHTQMFEALGSVAPHFAHISLLKSKEGEMSKRVGGFDIRSIREKGIDPMAINSFLAKLGTSEAPESPFTMESLIDQFSLGKFGKSAANYEYLDLERVNRKLLHVAKYDDVKDKLITLGMLDVDETFWQSVQLNITTLQDVKIWHDICKAVVKPVIIDSDFTAAIVELLPESEFSNDTWDLWIKRIKQETGKASKDLFLPIRLALTGMDNGPELQNLLPLLGRNKVIARLSGIAA